MEKIIFFVESRNCLIQGKVALVILLKSYNLNFLRLKYEYKKTFTSLFIPVIMTNQNINLISNDA